MSEKKFFFQSSMPRAGSTLLQNIFGQNPDFYVTPTSGLLDMICAARQAYSGIPEFKAQDTETMKKGFLSFCHGGMLEFYEDITDQPYILDKHRGWGVNYNFLKQFYPNPKIICMVRYLPDIFSSMEKRYRANAHIDSGVVEHNGMKGSTTEKRVEIWTDTIPIGIAIERMQQIIRENIADNMLFVRYENLTINPKKEMERIYKFLELPYFVHDFNNVTQVTHENDKIHGIFADHIIRSKVEFRPSDAERILGRVLCDKINAKCEWYNKCFGYPTA